MKKCRFCNEPIPIDEEQNHIEQNHIKIKESDFIKKEKFFICKFCELNVNKNEINQHEFVCGSKTKMCEKCGNYIKLKDFAKHKEEGCFDLLIFDAKEKFYIKNKNNYQPFDEKKEENIFKKIENDFKEVRNNILLSIQNNNNRINNNNNIYNKKNIHNNNNNNNELKSKRNNSKNSKQSNNKNNYIYLGDLNDIILKEKVKKIKKFEQEIKKLKRDLTCSKFIEYVNNDKIDYNNNNNDFLNNFYEEKKIYRKTNSTKYISNYKKNEYYNKIKENKKNLLKINFNRSNEKNYNNYNYYYNHNNNESSNNRYLNYIEKTNKKNNFNQTNTNNNNIYNNNNNKYSFNESLIKAIKHNFMN